MIGIEPGAEAHRDQRPRAQEGDLAAEVELVAVLQHQLVDVEDLGIEAVDDPRAYLELLIRDEDPMPWSAWGPLQRLAQAIYLTRGNPEQIGKLKAVVDVNRDYLASQLRGKQPEDYLNHLLAEIPSDS